MRSYNFPLNAPTPSVAISPFRTQPVVAVVVVVLLLLLLLLSTLPAPAAYKTSPVSLLHVLRRCH